MDLPFKETAIAGPLQATPARITGRRLDTTGSCAADTKQERRDYAGIGPIRAEGGGQVVGAQS